MFLVNDYNRNFNADIKYTFSSILISEWVCNNGRPVFQSWLGSWLERALRRARARQPQTGGSPCSAARCWTTSSSVSHHPLLLLLYLD